MEKQIVMSASPYNHKYYFEPKFNDIPVEIKEELLESITAIAEKVNAVITLGFYEDGNLFIEQAVDETVFVDDIGAELEIKKLHKEKMELLKSLRLWYLIYRSEQGRIVKEIVLLQKQGLSKEQLLKEIETKHGVELRVFAENLLN